MNTQKLTDEELRFLTQIRRYSSNLNDSDRKLLLAMVKKFAATADQLKRRNSPIYNLWSLGASSGSEVDNGVGSRTPEAGDKARCQQHQRRDALPNASHCRRIHSLRSRKPSLGTSSVPSSNPPRESRPDAPCCRCESEC